MYVYVDWRFEVIDTIGAPIVSETVGDSVDERVGFEEDGDDDNGDDDKVLLLVGIQVGTTLGDDDEEEGWLDETNEGE